MTDLLRPLHQALAALDAAGQVRTLFIRDDDAGWDDTALLQLLDTTATAGVPIDLAAIPQAISPALAAELARRHDAAPTLLGLHQHGCSHTNHQPEGRKAEFGPARDATAQRRDLLQGRDMLQQRLGGRIDAIFTPPWNRCAPHTPALLAALGFAALSRDQGAAPQQALPELPVQLDWTRVRRDGGPTAVVQALSAGLAAQPAPNPPLGLMLHHAVMDAAERQLLGRALHLLAAHPAVRCLPMRALLPTCRWTAANNTAAASPCA